MQDNIIKEYMIYACIFRFDHFFALAQAPKMPKITCLYTTNLLMKKIKCTSPNPNVTSPGLYDSP